MEIQWQILHTEPEMAKRLSQQIGCHPVTAAILIHRKITSARAAKAFLKTSLKAIRSPFALKDMDAAVDRIYTAIRDHEKILLFGDYDVDGVTATALLLEFFGYIRANVSHYIPHRVKEGYGLQPQHVADVAIPNHIKLIITADCGSLSHTAVKAAQDSGIDVIITDHHNITDDIPPALAVINPKRHDCTAGLENLAGVGVAFCLLICLRKYLRDHQFWQAFPEPNLKNYCDLVALGTIADMVPLVDENRIFSRTGLELINSGNRFGLTALLETSGSNKNYADAEDVAYRLAPRINAAGRMAEASKAVHLMTTRNMDTAREIAQWLNALNSKRQTIEKKILENIQAQLSRDKKLLQRRSLILAHSEWHEGVLGIVASRIVEKYFRPVILIATRDGIGKGSARSIPAVNLYNGLLACEDFFESFGGHAMAAGIKIRAENIPRFQDAFEKTIQSITRPEDFIPKLLIDQELDFADLSATLIDEIESLTPFGTCNPEPLFMARDISVVSSKIVGHHHRRMLLKQSRDPLAKTLSAIQFNIDTRCPLKESFSQIAFRARWNRWNGNKIAQIVIEEAIG